MTSIVAALSLSSSTSPNTIHSEQAFVMATISRSRAADLLDGAESGFFRLTSHDLTKELSASSGGLLTKQNERLHNSFWCYRPRRVEAWLCTRR